MKNALKDCANYCYEARMTCLESLQHSLEKGGKYAEPALSMQVVEAAQLSQVCADACCYGYDYFKPVAESCFKAYSAIAARYEAFNEPEYKKYAESFNKYAYACKAVCEIAGYEKNGAEKKGYEKTAA